MFRPRTVEGGVAAPERPEKQMEDIRPRFQAESGLANTAEPVGLRGGADRGGERMSPQQAEGQNGTRATPGSPRWGSGDDGAIQRLRERLSVG